MLAKCQLEKCMSAKLFSTKGGGAWHSSVKLVVGPGLKLKLTYSISQESIFLYCVGQMSVEKMSVGQIVFN